MVVKVIGIQSYSGVLDNGNPYSGKKLHVAVIDHDWKNMTGHPVEVIKISSQSEFYTVPIDVDNLYNVFFDMRGKVAFLAPAK